MRKTATRRSKAPAPQMLRLARKLQEPKVYFSGIEVGPPILPRSILLFGRRLASSLTDPPEQHHRFVAVVALQGEGTVCIDDQIHRLCPGGALLIFPFQSHCYLHVDPRIEWVFIGFEHGEDQRLESLRNHGPVTLDEGGREQLMNIFGKWHEPAHLDQIPLHLGILLHLLAEKARTQPARKTRTSGSPAESLIARINLFATQNVSQPFSLTDLARHIGLSPSHLRGRFHQFTGRSLGRHLRDLRLQHACNLLHNGQDSIGEISQQCGFDSLFSFSRAFRNALGCAPSTYRNQRIKSPKD